ncbi:Inorganic pyrophosphatase [Melia azedarach]|uniref:Inorganic pyrophosphatase n=1 Tax=Melia azedarach TaxID=155640 RepID=A0ACC1XB24_MELAZ|nr:Inorganic pyrophosphatase [Melia azedarach]
MADIVVVFDFDRTIIDGDSDNWVVTQMGLTQLFDELRSTLPWNSLMDRMMKELHSQGKTVEDIANCLRQCPLDSKIVAAIKSAHSLGCDLKIVSDANQFFIETIMEHHGLLGCFSKIHTNPTFVDEEGTLRILPYHGSTLSPHGCSLCPPNLCKGLVLDHICTSAPQCKKQRFIYLGDGRGDFCPTLKLRNNDYVMPRKNYPLWDRICSNQMLLKAEVIAWSNAEELQKFLLHLINTISDEENLGSKKTSCSNSSGCQSHTMPVYS